MEEEWEEEALELRIAMLDIFSDISEAYIKAGKNTLCITLATLLCQILSVLPQYSAIQSILFML